MEAGDGWMGSLRYHNYIRTDCVFNEAQKQTCQHKMVIGKV